MAPKPYWMDMTTVDFATGETAEWVAVMPVAAIEQHGPHLPVATDTAIAQANIEAVVARLPADVKATFLPIQAVGKSNEHIASPGTLTLGWETLTRLLVEIGESVARAGVRKIVFVNSHGGNVSVIDIVARELRVNRGMLAVATHWARLPKLGTLHSDFERTYGIHGGESETSIMLAARPDLVRMEHAKRFHSSQERFEQRFTHLRAHGSAAPFGWQAQDLSPDGTVGAADLATAEKGRAQIAATAEAFIELLRDVQAFDMADLWRP
jgi:creatinine amidohydrolase